MDFGVPLDPSDVDSADDVRAGWDEWDYNERLEALDSLANANLDKYGYDGVDVHGGNVDGSNGQYSDGTIDLPESLLTDTNPYYAIHETDHETIHAMNDQDGIPDSVNVSDYPVDQDFTDDQDQEIANHGDVGDQARVLDDDGDLGRWGGGTGGASADGGSEYAAANDAPPAEDLRVDIDWASGVWIDSTAADGSYAVDIYFTPTEGW